MGETYVIEVKHKHAIKLLQDLEEMNIIGIVKANGIENELRDTIDVGNSFSKERGEELLQELEEMKNGQAKGLTEEELNSITGSSEKQRYQEIMTEIDEMKKEWERDI